MLILLFGNSSASSSAYVEVLTSIAEANTFLPSVVGNANLFASASIAEADTHLPFAIGNANSFPNASTATGITYDPSVAIHKFVPADASTATGSAYDPSVAIHKFVPADASTATGSTYDPSVATAGNTTGIAGASTVEADTRSASATAEGNTSASVSSSTAEADTRSASVATAGNTTGFPNASTVEADTRSASVATEGNTTGFPNASTVEADTRSASATAEGNTSASATASTVEADTHSASVATAGNTSASATSSTATGSTLAATSSTTSNLDVAASVATSTGSTYNPSLSLGTAILIAVSEASANTYSATSYTTWNVFTTPDHNTAEADNLSPTIYAGGNLSLNADSSTVEGTTESPNVFTNSSIVAALSTANVGTYNPSVSSSTNISPTGDLSTAEGNTNTVSTAAGTRVSPTSSTASGLTIAPTIETVANREISAPTSAATGITPSVLVSLIKPDRYTYFRWAPRWIEAHYNTTSTLRLMYFLSLAYPNDFMKQVLLDTVAPSFYASVIQDRNVYIAKYTHPENHIPVVQAVVGGITSTILPKADLGTILYEKVKPVYCFQDSVIYVKNLDVREVSLFTDDYGITDLTSTFAAEPPTEDSFIIAENFYGDQFIYSQLSQVYNSTTKKLSLPTAGPYKIYYISETRFSGLKDGSNYITVGGDVVPIKPLFLSNVWDEYAKLKNISRRDGESNTNLKAKCQFLSLSRTAEQRISSSLGQAQAFIWNPTVPLTLTGSGIVSVNCLALERDIYIKNEIPYKDGNNFVLSRRPEGDIQLFYNTTKVDPNSYTVSGSFIIPNSETLKGVVEESIRVDYRHRIYSTESETLQSYNETNQPVIGLMTKNVKINNASKKIKEWRWNQELGQLSGTAGFDF
jgi:hypothetical protein